MAQWRIKEISDLTKVSVRMLHHYDKIALLKPSVRASNGYRWYSEQDLATLQHIIALKFFGFSLAQIKTMMQRKISIRDHLLAQQQMLNEQAEHLRQAQDALGAVLQRATTSENLNWNDLVTLIERYHMSEEIKNTYVSKLTEKQQERYLDSRQKYPKEFKAWEEAIEAINSGTLGDSEGPAGEWVINAFLDLMKANKKLEAAKSSIKMTKEDAAEITEYIKTCLTKAIPLTPEGAKWFGLANAAHRLRSWQAMYQEITHNLDAAPEGDAGKKLATQWRELLAEQSMSNDTEFNYGFMLLMDAVKTKMALKEQPTAIVAVPQQASNQACADDLKLIGNPMATDWIMRALRAHK
ncbi:MAG: MerR family transcriptional regulator [Candidatus Babeliales bacterium]|jgi:DNA-binding transcriptional MerR regulator